MILPRFQPAPAIDCANLTNFDLKHGIETHRIIPSALFKPQNPNLSHAHFTFTSCPLTRHLHSDSSHRPVLSLEHGPLHPTPYSIDFALQCSVCTTIRSLAHGAMGVLKLWRRGKRSSILDLKELRGDEDGSRSPLLTSVLRLLHFIWSRESCVNLWLYLRLLLSTRTCHQRLTALVNCFAHRRSPTNLELLILRSAAVR